MTLSGTSNSSSIMAKISFLLVVLCGLTSLDVSFAEQTTYGGIPAAVKYEAPAVEEKYPMKPEYKKMEDDDKKNYKRSVDDKTEETADDARKVTKVKANIVSIKNVNQLKDAVMQDILADPILGLGLGLGFRYRRYPYFGLYRPFPYYGLYRPFPYYGFGYRRFGYRRFGYRRFGNRRYFDRLGKLPTIPETGSPSADPAGLDFENDEDSEELDAIATPQRKWWNDVDEDQLTDADPQGRWWSPEELDEITDLLPTRRTCSMRAGRRICLPRPA